MFVLFLVIVLAGGPIFASQSMKRYEITITNLTRGQIFSPPIVISHDWNFQLFKLGDPASPQLAALAEEGDASLLINQIDQDPGLNYAVSDGPVLPGKSVVLEVSAAKRARWISAPFSSKHESKEDCDPFSHLVEFHGMFSGLRPVSNVLTATQTGNTFVGVRQAETTDYASARTFNDTFSTRSLTFF